jgi:hypothetical protein
MSSLYSFVQDPDLMNLDADDDIKSNPTEEGISPEKQEKEIKKKQFMGLTEQEIKK